MMNETDWKVYPPLAPPRRTRCPFSRLLHWFDGAQMAYMDPSSVCKQTFVASRTASGKNAVSAELAQ